MQATLMLIGVVSVMAAIVGGGLEAFNIKVPGLTGAPLRQVLLAAFGIGIFGLGLLEPWGEPGSVPPTQPQPGEVSSPGFEGTWTMVSWVEESGPVQLGFAPTDGELTIDEDRAAVWTFGVDDQFADDTGEAASACEGVVDLQDRLTSTRGPDELFWTANMRSLRVDIGLAFCGRALDSDRGEVISRFELLLDGDLLEMRNEHGAFTWRRS